MNGADILSVLQWWLIFLSLGLIFFPLSTLLFNSFFDRGYIFAKILGLLLLSYSSWLLASLHILPFGTISLFVLLGIFLVINSVVAYRKKTSTKNYINLKIFALEEGLFLVGLIFWAWVRSFEPSIHGLEKFMDFGFINSILQSTYFPPKDMWMTPLSINYYYFGHLVTAVMIKFSLLRPEVGYNLMLATLFALTLTASFALGSTFYSFFVAHNLKLNNRRILAAGAFAGFLVALGGNLHSIYAFFQSYSPPDNPVPFWQLPLSFNFSGYWYPNATRFIPFTIHEFPIYSFVVADLHGHVLNIPFVLLIIAMMVKIFRQSNVYLFDYLLLGLLIGISLMTNVLDGPIYLLLTFLTIAFGHIRTQKLGSALKAAFKTTSLVTLLAIVFSLPFWISFKPFASGIGVLCAPSFLIDKGRLGLFLFEANHCARSPWWMLSILWGFFYFVLFSFFYLIVIKGRQKLSQLEDHDFFPLLLAGFATILIIIPEFFYVKDIYPAHYRANTVFKFGYQAFIIFGLASGYALMRILSKVKNIPYRLVVVALFFLVAIYPNFAIRSYYHDLKGEQSLDGLSYLNTLYPGDYQTILWIRQNIKNQPIILEGQGDSYTDYARISSNTGLPTVIGWPVHEWLWRGSYDEAGKRSSEVTTLYESADVNLTQQLLKKYKVSYVVIGKLERDKYKNLNEAKFQQLGQMVFQNTDIKIYQMQKIN